MAKADTVYSLFGMKSPYEVAQEQMQASRELLARQQDPYARLGTALGLGLGRAFGGEDPRIARSKQFGELYTQARADVAQEKEARQKAQQEALDQRLGGFEGALLSEQTGRGNLPDVQPIVTKEDEAVAALNDRARTFDAFANKLSGIKGFESQVESAQLRATEARVQALAARKELAQMRKYEADAKKAEAEAKVSALYDGVNITPENFRDVANKMIRGGDVDNGLALLRIYEKDPGSIETDFNFIASTEFAGEDVKDPSVATKIMNRLINVKRQNPTVAPAFKAAQESLDESLKAAKAAKKTFTIANQSLEILDSGDVNVGSFAKTRQGAEKFYNEVIKSWGLDPTSDAVPRTEVLLASSGAMAGALLSSGTYGSGTGISKVDLERAELLSGALDSLTPEGMEFILRMNQKMAKLAIENHNTNLDNISPRFWENNPFRTKEYYQVTLPQEYGGEAWDSITDANSIAEFKGQTIKYIQGAWRFKNGSVAQ